MSERDYKHEYARDHSSLKAKKDRAKRNLWNRRLKGSVPEGMEIDHKTPLKSGGSNDRDNIRFRSVSANRADKSMQKSAVLGAVVGAAGADEGIKNRAAGGAAGEVAALATTPLGVVAGLEYLRAQGHKHGVNSLQGMSRADMYNKAIRNPINFVKGLGVKGSAITTGATYAVGMPAAYLAGKYVGTGLDDNKQNIAMQKQAYYQQTYASPGHIQMEYSRVDPKPFKDRLEYALQSDELKNIIQASTNPYVKKQRERIEKKLRKLKENSANV
jgi:hypothetical protein